MSVDVEFQRLVPEAKLPQKMTPGAAGMDICSVETVMIPPGAWVLVSTGLAVAIPEGHEGQIRPRSGMCLKYGLTVLNAPGTVDSDYRGPVRVLLINQSKEPRVVRPGERIAQLVIAPVTNVQVREVEGLGETKRGGGGFGSTGV
jgi:dUTP pyrophosphatase